MRGNGGIWLAEQVSNTASLSPKVVPLQALPRKGCAWRDTEYWGLGRWKEEVLKLKVHGLVSKGLRFRVQKIYFVTFNPFTC